MDLQANMADIPGWPINDGNPPSCIIQPVVPDARYRNDLEWDVLRTDLLHPVISGNKLFKLRLHLSGALREGKKGILTFGGAHSNHIHATAFAARAAGLASIGIIRGEEPANRSDTLRDAADWGMQLIFLSREEYRHMTNCTPLTLAEQYPDHRIIPEGGYGTEGMLGAADILSCIPHDRYDWIACACGTGTMMAGLVHASLPGQKVLGVSVLKGYRELDQRIRDLLPAESIGKHFHTDHDHHLGGYAKTSDELISFMNRFHAMSGIPTDIIYTGKLMLAIEELSNEGYFPRGSRVLAIHSGGLQGNRSLKPGKLTFS